MDVTCNIENTPIESLDRCVVMCPREYAKPNFYVMSTLLHTRYLHVLGIFTHNLFPIVLEMPPSDSALHSKASALVQILTGNRLYPSHARWETRH